MKYQHLKRIVGFCLITSALFVANVNGQQRPNPCPPGYQWDQTLRQCVVPSDLRSSPVTPRDAMHSFLTLVASVVWQSGPVLISSPRCTTPVL